MSGPTMSLSSFELYLERGGRKRVTVSGHVSNIQRLYKANPRWDSSAEELESTLLQLRRKGLQFRSLNRLLLSARIFAKCSKIDAPLGVKLFKEEPSYKATLSDEEIERVLAVPRIKNSPIGIWDTMTMFFSILAYSGARPGEVARLTVDTVDLGSNCFLFLDTKTRENRGVPIHPILLEKYKLREFVARKTSYIFPSARGGLNAEGLPVLSQADWNRNFRMRLDALGINRKSVSTYSLRHSYITRLIGADINLFKVQRIVGHKRIETTAIYTHLSSKQDQQTVLSDPLGLGSVGPEKALRRIREIIAPIVERDTRFSWSYTDNSIEIRVK